MVINLMVEEARTELALEDHWVSLGAERRDVTSPPSVRHGREHISLRTAVAGPAALEDVYQEESDWAGQAHVEERRAAALKEDCDTHEADEEEYEYYEYEESESAQAEEIANPVLAELEASDEYYEEYEDDVVSPPRRANEPLPGGTPRNAS